MHGAVEPHNIKACVVRDNIHNKLLSLGVGEKPWSGNILLVTSLKILQSDWLLKCKDIVIMTLRGAKTIYLDTWYATIEKT